MYAQKHQDQGINALSQTDYLPILITAFLTDRRSRGFADETINFYRKKLKYFLDVCDGQAVTQVSQLTADLIRRYILELRDGHNDSGVHACFRSLRTLLYWVEEEEFMPFDWKNPIRKVKAPKLPVEPIESIPLQDIHALIETCKQSFAGSRDRAMLMGLLDTGARAQEFLNLNVEDVELASGAVLIRQGKGRKPRMVFLGRKAVRIKYVERLLRPLLIEDIATFRAQVSESKRMLLGMFPHSSGFYPLEDFNLNAIGSQ